MRNILKSIFSGRGQKIYHTEQFPMVSGCIIQPHLKAYSEDLCVNALAGEALIPPCDYSKISKKDQLTLITNSAPVIIYNALYYDDFPGAEKIVHLIKELENNLQENSDNPWVRMLYANYKKGLKLTNESLLKEAEKEPVLYGISRAEFEQICTSVLIKIISECTGNRVELFKWLKGHST